MFAERFDIPGAHLRPVQREAVRLAQTMPSPGLMIIEANMGEGKTEAALLSAEVLAGRFGCGGVYYGLPTQTTANAMFHRTLGWIGRLPAPEQGTLGSVFLSHGKREQNEEYFNLTERTSAANAFEMRNGEYIVDDEDRTGGDGASNGFEPSIEAVVNSWLSGRKRGNLSDFVDVLAVQASRFASSCVCRQSDHSRRSALEYCVYECVLGDHSFVAGSLWGTRHHAQCNTSAGKARGVS